jgi:hypothetical protein
LIILSLLVVVVGDTLVRVVTLLVEVVVLEGFELVLDML